MNDFSFTVKYVYSPAYRGYRNSLFVPEEPDEPEDVSVYEVIDENGLNVILPEDLLVYIEEHILKHLRD